VQYVINTNKNLDLFGQTIWTIWYQKKLLRSSNKKYPINHVIPDVLAALNGFIQTIPPKPPDSVIQVPQRLKWKSPPSSCLIINFDGVILKEEN